MSDSRLRGDVIPLFPGRTADHTPPGSALATRLRGPAEHISRFLAPAVLIAAGVFLVTLMVAGAGSTLGWLHASPVPTASALGTWVFLGASGAGITTRGIRLARVRWR